MAIRAVQLILAVITVGALLTQFVLVLRGTNVLIPAGEAKPATATRVIRYFSYFTVQSNILVAVTALTLVANPRRDGRVWRVVRLDAIVGIAVTGLIYVTLLRPVVDLHGVSKLTDVAFHYVVPLLAVMAWLLLGPRPRIDEVTLLGFLVWPIAYVGYTLIHGAASHWYPYPFIDVTTFGYPVALRNGAGVCLLLLGIAVVFLLVDRKLATGTIRRSPTLPYEGVGTAERRRIGTD
jgi:hypothetical protein